MRTTWRKKGVSYFCRTGLCKLEVWTNDADNDQPWYHTWKKTWADDEDHTIAVGMADTVKLAKVAAVEAAEAYKLETK
jgi:hypothetical protein